MGPPKQRWTSGEEAALRAGVAKHGVGKWRAILKDPHFGFTLRYRSNVDLKDKWRNMNAISITSASCEKGRNAMTKTQSIPKNGDHAMSISTVTSDIDNEIVHEKPIAVGPTEVPNASNPNQSLSRLDSTIMESIKNLNEPTGSHRTTIANYIEEQYWPSGDFDHLLSAKLKDLTTNGKLIKVKRKYRIAPNSPFSEERSPKMLLLEDVQTKPFKIGRDEEQNPKMLLLDDVLTKPFKIGRNDSKTLTRSQVDAELARMATMTAEEAAAAAARAVKEAETLMAEAEGAAKEAEAAEADARAAEAFMEAAFLTLKNRNATNLIAQA